MAKLHFTVNTYMLTPILSYFTALPSYQIYSPLYPSLHPSVHLIFLCIAMLIVDISIYHVKNFSMQACIVANRVQYLFIVISLEVKLKYNKMHNFTCTLADFDMFIHLYVCQVLMKLQNIHGCKFILSDHLCLSHKI